MDAMKWCYNLITVFLLLVDVTYCEDIHNGRSIKQFELSTRIIVVVLFVGGILLAYARFRGYLTCSCRKGQEKVKMKSAGLKPSGDDDKAEGKEHLKDTACVNIAYNSNE